MNAHTPGPWVVDEEDALVYAPNAGLADMICAPPPEWCGRSLEYWPANARLIASAPDLLAAAQGALALLESVAPHHPQPVALRAAIAKATGGAA